MRTCALLLCASLVTACDTTEIDDGLADAAVEVTTGGDTTGPETSGGADIDDGDTGEPDVAADLCSTDEECDDGQFCNGVETCAPGAQEADDFGCLEGVPPSPTDPNPLDCARPGECDEETDSFSLIDASAGDPCDDGIACTFNDVCLAGGDCEGAPDDSACDDGLFCNGVETCNPLTGCSTGAAPVGVDEDLTDCLAPTACNEETDGFDDEPVAADAPCDDEEPCTDEDLCDAEGGCVPGEGVVCDDENPCTTDTCEPGVGCVSMPITCDAPPADFCDGLVWTTYESTGTCVSGTCEYTQTSTDCDDGNLCTTDACDAFAGCGTSPVACDTPPPSACDGGNHVTWSALGACDGATGACEYSDTVTSCNDNNLCTTDACDPGAGCSNLDLPCAPAPADECDGNAVVTYGEATACDPGSGQCSYASASTPCDANATCAGGACACNAGFSGDGLTCTADGSGATFADVSPIFQAKCGPCHSGSHQIGSADIAAAYSKTQQSSSYSPGQTQGFASLVRVKDGTMPPGGVCSGDPVQDAGNPACLTQEELDILQAWIDGGQLPPP